MERAKSVIDEIINAQSVDVDAVSGATMSSNGILEAVADALGLEFENTNSTIQEHHGGHGKGPGGGFGGKRPPLF
ncbi:MAG: FMN-binding protein [Oscillospiraceae bacterium]|nr:FMN-binding protein [Oscillospiraceae bacterium]